MGAASLHHLHPLTEMLNLLSASRRRRADLYADGECYSLQNASLTHPLIRACAHIPSTTLFLESFIITIEQFSE